jgi:hypothetical protein
VSPISVSVEISNDKEEVVTTTTNIPSGTEAKVNGVKTQKSAVRYTKVPANKVLATVTNTAAPAIINEGVAVTASNPAVVNPTVTPSKIKVDAASLLASVDSKAAVKPVSNPVVINPKAQQPSVKVNANSLLSSVEGELDDSFRTRVLNTVSKNYNKVKTSVATRNHQ